MKKALVLLISIIALFPVISLAETMVQKPNLPTDYERWPNSFSDSCKLDDKNVYAISAYGRIDSATNTFEFVLVITANGSPIYIWHVNRYPSYKWTNSRGFFPSANQWIELNFRTDDRTKVPLMFKAGVKRTLNKERDEVYNSCQQLEEKSDEFLNSLVNKIEGK